MEPKKKNLVIIGANEFQNPLILKAKAMGCCTHVFAWQSGDIGESTADYFYPVSIVEKDRILDICRKLDPVGIVSIGSDLASLTVNYVGEKLGLTCNGIESSIVATNKHLMRLAFEKAGLPSCKSCLVSSAQEAQTLDISYPVIVKPTDRSGSRGVFKVEKPSQLSPAIEKASSHSFEKKALVEEFAQGREYSIEYVSWQGQHHFLACTEKFTTGAPLFVETGHLQPPLHMTDEALAHIQALVPKVLDCLGVKFGASHTELKIDSDGSIKLIECGARMGGDCIGSDLVYISRGIDFVGACVDISCGTPPSLLPEHENRVASIRFVFNQRDIDSLEYIRANYPDCLYFVSNILPFDGREISDSSTRYGFYIISAPTMDKMTDILSHVDFDLN
jgi:biotin carboxylase